MARHLCIVAREHSPLYGYLTIAFRDRPAGTPTLDIVLDRRLADTRNAGDAASRASASQDRRRHSAVDEAVHARGYAIFTGAGGGVPSRQDEAFIERAIGLLADVERRGPLALRFGGRRRAFVGGLLKSVAAVLIIGMTVAVILRLGGIGRIADAASQWTDATVRRVEDAWLNLRGQPDLSTSRGERGREPSAPAAPSSPAPAQPAERPAPTAATPAPASLPVSTVVGQAPAAARASRGPADEARVAPPPVPTPPARVAASPVVSASSRAPAAETARPAPPSAPREAVTPADMQSLPAFTGLVPRVEMSRQTSPSGSGVVYSVRLGDSGGRVISGAQVWLRGQSDNGQMRETRLDDTERAGVYRSGPLPADLMPAGGLSVRVFFSNMRIEVPIDH